MWENPYDTATFMDRDAAERRLKRLRFEPYIVEYNLKEN